MHVCNARFPVDWNLLQTHVTCFLSLSNTSLSHPLLTLFRPLQVPRKPLVTLGITISHNIKIHPISPLHCSGPGCHSSTRPGSLPNRPLPMYFSYSIQIMPKFSA